VTARHAREWCAAQASRGGAGVSAMRSTRRVPAQDWPALLGSMLGGLWRWRVELVLVGAAGLVWRVLAGPLGAVPALVLVAWAVSGMLVLAPTRALLVRTLRVRRLRRRFRRGWTDAGLPAVALGRLRPVPAGEVAAIRVASGGSIEDLQARRERLAASIRVRELRVTRDPGDASRGTVTFVRRDPLAGTTSAPWPHADASRLSLWEPVPVGVDELGQVLSIGLVERNILLGGEPGAGKSAGLSLLVASAALDPECRLWLLDGKLVELSAWAPCAQRLAGPDVEEAIELLRELRSEMDQRYRDLLASGARKIDRHAGLPLHVLACDELAFYLLAEDHKQRTAVAELLRDLVARGRAAGVIVCAATQKPAADVVPSALRDLFGFRLALRCNTRDASDTILGAGWASLGHDASAIAPGQRGVGLLLAEDGLPIRMRGFHLADDDVAAIAGRASALRADTWFAKGAERAA
jgi:FtsK/SpoIIIE family